MERLQTRDPKKCRWDGERRAIEPALSHPRKVDLASLIWETQIPWPKERVDMEIDDDGVAV